MFNINVRTIFNEYLKSFSLHVQSLETVSFKLDRMKSDEAYSGVPVSLELFVVQKLFLLLGPWYDVLSRRLSFMGGGVRGRHHVLNIFNHGVAGGRHDDLKDHSSTAKERLRIHRDNLALLKAIIQRILSEISTCIYD